MLLRGVVILVLVTAVVATTRTPGGMTGTVIVDSAEVFDRPENVGFVIAELGNGDEVVIDHETPDGWIAIQPPGDAFCWIDERYLDRSEPGPARIQTEGAAPRSGNASARLPGVPLGPLKRGTRVTVLGRRPCVVPQTVGSRVFRAIEPPPGLLFYIEARTVRMEDGQSGNLAAPRASIAPLPIDVSIATPGNSLRPSTLPPAMLEGLARVESAHRGELRGAIDTWNLDAVKRGYQDLANRFRDADSRALLEGRIARVSQQMELARQARRFEILVQESRRRDLSAVNKPTTTDDDPFAYDAVGMLQRSSKLVRGQRVYALIADDGTTTAYLSIPPGILTDRYVSDQVGVIGQVHYDAKLRNRVIEVEDLTPLREAP